MLFARLACCRIFLALSVQDIWTNEMWVETPRFTPCKLLSIKETFTLLRYPKSGRPKLVSWTEGRQMVPLINRLTCHRTGSPVSSTSRIYMLPWSGHHLLVSVEWFHTELVKNVKGLWGLTLCTGLFFGDIPS
jgi:hypothetical protein